MECFESLKSGYIRFSLLLFQSHDTWLLEKIQIFFCFLMINKEQLLEINWNINGMFEQNHDLSVAGSVVSVRSSLRE